MYCQHCGNTIPDGSTFCSSCGQRVNGPIPASPQPVQQAAPIKIDSNTGTILSILLSAAVIVSTLMPWLVVDASWFYNFSGNLFKTFRYLMDLDYFLSSIILIGLGIACTILQAYAIYTAVSKPSDTYSSGNGAGICSLVLVGFFFLFVMFEKSSSNSEFFDVSAFVHYGAGFFCCLVFSVIQVIACNVLLNQQKTAKSVPDNNLTVCPHCGTKYARLASTTVCPNCHRPMTESTSAPKPQAPIVPHQSNTITCPFCKRIYPAGTVYCEDCHAQIGAKAAPASSSSAYCRKCGNKLSSDDLFCPNCGTKR